MAATRILYDAIARGGLSPRILFVSTGQVYGPAESAAAADESAELRPVSPYAASKAAADLLSYQVTRHPGLDVIRVRPFNQVGPRQPPQYAAGHFARQLARIEAGLRRTAAWRSATCPRRRDLTDVRDMVEAYRLLLDRGRPGEVYNVGTGVAVRMADVLEMLRAECRVPVEVVPRAERMRPADAGARPRRCRQIAARNRLGAAVFVATNASRHARFLAGSSRSASRVGPAPRVPLG